MHADLSDERVRARVYDLFDTSFDRLSKRIRIAESFGALWHEVSTAFIRTARAGGGAPVAHVGVIEIPMMIAGHRRLVAGVHAVCTHPDHRGQGHARAALTQALNWIDARYDLAILTTEIADFYAQFGFRTVPESVFEIGSLRARGRAAPSRPVDEADGRDLDRVWRLLSRREPVSNVLASLDSGWLFLIDEALASWGLRRLYYAEDLDAVLAFEVHGSTLTLLDIVASRLPTLESVLERVPAEFDRVELLFTPDRVWSGPVALRPWDPADRLMVRGEFPVTEPFMLTPLARC